MRRTKLVSTLGPASVGRVRELIEAGMDVARVNFSHGSDHERTAAFEAVRRASGEAGRAVGILADLPGPKVRLGELADEEVILEAGGRFVLRSAGGPGDASGATTNHPGLAGDLRPGDVVLVADGAVELRVVECRDDVLTEIVRGGAVRSRAGINVPSERLSLPPLTEKDRSSLARALELGTDLIAQSFVRGPDDVNELRQLVGEHGTPVIAKVETRAAVEHADRILEVADGIMIARGDLGVEIPFEEVPVVQKELVRRAVTAGAPVIVATQMLESMTTSPRPTRAEASDVANAVLDGADAILLSAETAIGRFPVEAARAAGRIAEAAERSEPLVAGGMVERTPGTDPAAVAGVAASLTRKYPGVAAIACFTRTGLTAALLAAARPPVPVVAFSPYPEVLRRLSLRRSVVPSPSDLPADTDAMIGMMDRGLRGTRLAAQGALVVMVGSTPFGRAQTNFIKLHRLGSPE